MTAQTTTFRRAVYSVRTPRLVVSTHPFLRGCLSLSQKQHQSSSQFPCSNSHHNNQPKMHQYRLKHSYYRPPKPSSGGAGSNNNKSTSNTFSNLVNLDASPFLDPTLYIKKTAAGNTRTCGTEGAKRLVNGQREIRDWIRMEGSVQFCLQGHGIPVQLLQDHIDCAWGVLDGVGNGLGCDIAECSFRNGKGALGFEWIRIRTSDCQNGSYPWPIHQPDRNIHDDLEHGMQLYLTVMSRISTVFGAVLNDETNVGTNRMRFPHKYWSAELKRGYMYPPGIPTDSGRGEGWTSPPIVELIQSERAIDGTLTVENSEVPCFVRITLQGIPSSFWRNHKADDMAPVSMVFEACFQCSDRKS